MYNCSSSESCVGTTLVLQYRQFLVTAVLPTYQELIVHTAVRQVGHENTPTNIPPPATLARSQKVHMRYPGQGTQHVFPTLCQHLPSSKMKFSTWGSFHYASWNTTGWFLWRTMPYSISFIRWCTMRPHENLVPHPVRARKLPDSCNSWTDDW